MKKLNVKAGMPAARAPRAAGKGAPEMVRPEGPCSICEDLGYVVRKGGVHAEAEVCTCQADCVRCEGRRYVFLVEDGYEVVKPCVCSGVFARVQRYNEARIPAGYARKRLSLQGTSDPEIARRHGIELDYDGFYDRQNPTLRAALEHVRRYEMDFHNDQGRGLVLMGGFGIGKTHLVCALISRLTLGHGVSCRFVDYHELTSRIRATFDGQGDETESSIIESLVTTEVLVIDDIGKAQASAWALSVLDQIVTRRYNARRIILATTNYLPEHELEHEGMRHPRRRDLSQSLEERIGERLVSRLRATCDFVRLEAPDYRVHGPKPSR